MGTKPCTELAKLGALPLPTGPLERRCELRTFPHGKTELAGPYEIRRPDGLRVATGQFVDGQPYGRWQLFDEKGEPKSTFDYGAMPLKSGIQIEGPIPDGSRLVPRVPSE